MKLHMARVLVVDDDAEFCEALGRWLTMLGHEPLIVGSAEEALEHLTAGAVDVMLLDLQLPGIHGHALLREMSRRDFSIPVVVISGTGSMEDVIEILRRRAVDYLRKPFRMEDLSAALDRALTATDEHRTGPGPAPSSGHEQKSLEQGSDDSTSGSPDDPRLMAIRLIGRLAGGEIDLPTIDGRAPKIQRLIDQPNHDAARVADALDQDQTLIASALRLVQWLWRPPTGGALSLEQACDQPGGGVVLAIALGLLVKNALSADRDPYRAAQERMWRNSLASAHIATRLARRIDLPGARNLFLLALLHNLGEPWMLKLLAAEDGIVRSAHPPHRTTIPLEQMTPEISRVHEKFGEELARSWSMPPQVIRLAGHHHQPAAVPEPDEQRLTRGLVLVSWGTACASGFTCLPGQEKRGAREHLAALGLDQSMLDGLCHEAAGWIDAIPADINEDLESGGAGGRSRQSSGDDGDNRRIVILLVDDDASFRESFRRVVEDECASVIEAPSGLHALRLLETERVDIVVADQMMPGMEGVTLLETISRQLPAVIRVLLTGHPGGDVFMNAINRGKIHKALAKQLPPSRIREEIHELVNQCLDAGARRTPI